MHAPHLRPRLPNDTRVDGVAIWLLVVLPWVIASSVFLFDTGAVMQALWVDDTAGALEYVLLHVGVLLGCTVVSIGLALLLGFLDQRRLRGLGLVRPFPWGFAAIGGIVYVIGRHVVLQRVTSTKGAPLWASATLYLAWYTMFGVWAAWSVTAGLASLDT